jgi:phosphoglycolate phosphatase-like HAD superfamily hydrolase
MDYKKLILFDIDGTLIRHVGESEYTPRVQYAANLVYGVNVSDSDVANFHGSVDKDITWSIVSPSGVKYEIFDSKFDEFSKVMYEYLITKAKHTKLYQKIHDAETLALRIKTKKDMALGLLTGNVRSIAFWKLEHAGLGGIFSWGVFGDQANDRIELAKMVPHEAHAEFHVPFRPDQIYVLGDTIYDIRCARSIGAQCIAVTTGRHGLRAELESEKPDLVIDSLMDTRVLQMLF